MLKVDKEVLVSVKGGSNTISGTVISAFTGLVKVLYDAGKSVGSSIRRMIEDELCPLE